MDILLYLSGTPSARCSYPRLQNADYTSVPTHETYSAIANLYSIIVPNRADAGPPPVFPQCLQSSSIAPRVDIPSQLLLRVEFLVFPRRPPLGHKTRDDGQAATCDDHAAAGLVSGFLGAEEKVGREPVGDLQEVFVSA